MSTWQVIFQGATAIIAILGLLLSCYSLYLHRRDKRPDIRLSLNTVVETDSSVLPGRRPDQKHILTISLANGGPIPIRIAGIYCGLKKIPKGIAVDLDDDPQPPFRLSEGDAESWTVDRDELKRDLFRELNRKQLLRDLEQPENWIPDDPSENNRTA